MTRSENKSVARQWYEEILNKKTLDEIDVLVALNYVDHYPLVPLNGSREGLKLLMGAYVTAFPDLQLTVEDMIAEEDKVAVRFTARATHQGPFQGIAPTGRSVTVTAQEVLRIGDGKLVEHWGEVDLFGLLQQLGAVPTPDRSN